MQRTAIVTGGTGGLGAAVTQTLLDDGFRVVVRAFNSGTQHDAPTRETPALTMKQLREIALSPEWDRYR